MSAPSRMRLCWGMILLAGGSHCTVLARHQRWASRTRVASQNIFKCSLHRNSGRSRRAVLPSICFALPDNDEQHSFKLQGETLKRFATCLLACIFALFVVCPGTTPSTIDVFLQAEVYGSKSHGTSSHAIDSPAPPTPAPSLIVKSITSNRVIEPVNTIVVTTLKDRPVEAGAFP